jgi:hypothetical protein
MKPPRYVVVVSLLALCAMAIESTPALLAEEARDALFHPPADSGIPDDEFGKVVKLGQQIFLRPGQYAGAYVGARATEAADRAVDVAFAGSRARPRAPGAVRQHERLARAA